MRYSLGQTWDGTTCIGEAKGYTWEEAKQAVADLNASGGFGGHQDWELPHIEDLHSLVYCTTGFEDTMEIPTKSGGTKTVGEWCKNVDNQQPLIDRDIFPNTPTEGHYWSSSSVAGYDDFAWVVDFGDGNGYYVDAKAHYSDAKGVECDFRVYVRLVLPPQ